MLELGREDTKDIYSIMIQRHQDLFRLIGIENYIDYENILRFDKFKWFGLAAFRFSLDNERTLYAFGCPVLRLIINYNVKKLQFFGITILKKEL